jgi:hypothetical protein
MTLLQIIAICACLACILAKWMFALKQSRVEHFLEVERVSYKKARNDLNEMVQKRKILIHTQKQILAKSAASQRNIGRLSQAQKKLTGQVKKEEELQVRQKEMISQLQNRG